MSLTQGKLKNLFQKDSSNLKRQESANSNNSKGSVEEDDQTTHTSSSKANLYQKATGSLRRFNYKALQEASKENRQVVAEHFRHFYENKSNLNTFVETLVEERRRSVVPDREEESKEELEAKENLLTLLGNRLKEVIQELAPQLELLDSLDLVINWRDQTEPSHINIILTESSKDKTSVRSETIPRRNTVGSHSRRKSMDPQELNLPTLIQNAASQIEEQKKIAASQVIRTGVMSGKGSSNKHWRTYNVRLTTNHLQFVLVSSKKHKKPLSLLETDWSTADLDYEVVFSSTKVIGKKDGKYCLELLGLANRFRMGFDSEREMQNWHTDIQKTQSQRMNSNLNLTSAVEAGPSQSSGLAKAIQELLKVPGNDKCADCGQEKPSWVCINHGTFICIDCAGIHRSLGTHISQVRSLQLDKIESSQLENLKYYGNRKFNAVWEANIPPSATRPTKESSFTDKRNWIKAKYEDKLYLNSSAWEVMRNGQSAKPKVKPPLPPRKKSSDSSTSSSHTSDAPPQIKLPSDPASKFPLVRVLFAFIPSSSKELEAFPGEVLEVWDSSETDWWLCNRKDAFQNNVFGWVPSSHLELFFKPDELSKALQHTHSSGSISSLSNSLKTRLSEKNDSFSSETSSHNNDILSPQKPYNDTDSKSSQEHITTEPPPTKSSQEQITTESSKSSQEQITTKSEETNQISRSGPDYYSKSSDELRQPPKLPTTAKPLLRANTLHRVSKSYSDSPVSVVDSPQKPPLPTLPKPSLNINHPSFRRTNVRSAAFSKLLERFQEEEKKALQNPVPLTKQPSGTYSK